MNQVANSNRTLPGAGPADGVALSVKPNGESAKSRITDTMRRWCLQSFGARLKAIILTGSLARDEATSKTTDQGLRFLSDAEFMVILTNDAEIPSPEMVTLIRSGVEEELRNQGIICKLSFGAVYESFLLDLGETIFGYELLTCGEVVYGDSDMLGNKAGRVLPVSREDAWRMLANRTVELLDIVPELVDGVEPLSEAAQYRIAKLYCDMATSLLVFKQEFVAGYQARAAKLQELHERGLLSGLPLDEDWFVGMLRRCAKYKISHSWDGTSPFLTFDSLQQAVTVLSSLWTWELAQMHDVTLPSPQGMLRLHMQRQALKERLRGWAYVVRRRGVIASLPHAGRWLRLARCASPRYCVYAAALETVSSLEFQVSSGGNSAQRGPLETRNSKLETALNWLPMAYLSAHSAPDIKDVAEAILWNYHEFLVETRA